MLYFTCSIVDSTFKSINTYGPRKRSENQSISYIKSSFARIEYIFTHIKLPGVRNSHEPLSFVYLGVFANWMNIRANYVLMTKNNWTVNSANK